MDSQSKKAVQELPKAELHIHLEGAVRPATVEEMTRRTEPGFSLKDAVWYNKFYIYKDLHDFVTTMQQVMNNCLRTPEDYERITYELLEDQAAQNVIYTEPSFDPFRGQKIGIGIDELLDAVKAGRERAYKAFGIRSGILVGFGREHGSDSAAGFIDQVTRDGSGVVGIDLHGDETAAGAEVFTAVYKAAREAGLGLRAHAGEGRGPEEVRDVINQLKVDRIAHGIRSVEDPDLMKELARLPVTLDISPSSNLRIGLVDSFKKHPVRPLFDAGVKVSVSTDDPLFFNTSVTDEYLALHRQLGFSVDDLRKVTGYAIDGAFLDEAGKEELRAKL